jgi:hypothetical protein
LKLFGIIRKSTGRVEVFRKEEIEAFGLQNGRTDKDVYLTIEFKVAKKKRSSTLNSYYWFLIDEITKRLRDLGNEVDKDLVHEFLKGKFLYTELVDEKTGEIMKLPRSTTTCNTDEFNAYIEDIKRFSAQVLDLPLPDAGQQLNLIDDSIQE